MINNLIKYIQTTLDYFEIKLFNVISNIALPTGILDKNIELLILNDREGRYGKVIVV